MEHEEMVRVLKKPGEEIADGLPPETADFLHHAVGISTEAGEILDIAKKLFVYDKFPDRDHVIEELGDLEFYMEGLRQNMEITREETIAHNILKLDKRYDRYQYSNEAAIARADKAEGE